MEGTHMVKEVTPDSISGGMLKILQVSDNSDYGNLLCSLYARVGEW